MRVGFFSQWYEPEPGPAVLTAVTARALAARGHEVHVLTGFPNPTGTLTEATVGSRGRARCSVVSNVTRVPLYLNQDKSAARRVTAALLGLPALPLMYEAAFSVDRTTTQIETPPSGESRAQRSAPGDRTEVGLRG